MLRPDLLALTPDDLAAMANRGLVKRAERELAAGEVTAQWEEGADGTLTASWSDGAKVTLPGLATLKQARCNCGALEMCRHVLRTVLGWQARAAAAGDGEKTPPEPWDPGGIADADLAAQCAKGVVERATGLWKQGVLAELLRTAKPTARFHAPGHTVRFPVPNDARYAFCSCSEPAPCVHAVLGVRAFRELPAEQPCGVISAGPLDVPVPAGVLSAAEACLDELLVDGLASSSAVWRDRVRRVAAECETAGLLWPAQLLEELAVDFDSYHAGDAAFQPTGLRERSAELLLRLDAIRAGRAPVPQAFIRGLRSDRDSDLGSSRMIGLGALVRQERRSTTLSVILQDTGSGNLLALEKTFAEADPAVPRKAFHLLSHATAAKDANLGQLARGQLVMQGGRRTAAGRLTIGRARAAVSPQGYAWESLVAPVLVEDFAELEARLGLLPPAPFRRRRAAADFHVCPLASVANAAFDPGANAVVAELTDAAGGTAWLVHPWTERGRGGAEALLASLRSPGRPRFVSGWIQRAGGGLVVRPAAYVWEQDGARRGVVPWLEAPGPAAPETPETREEGGDDDGTSGQAPVYAAALDLANALLLSGSRRLTSGGWPGWSRVEAELEASGLHRGAAVVRAVPTSANPVAPGKALLKLLTLAESVR